MQNFNHGQMYYHYPIYNFNQLLEMISLWNQIEDLNSKIDIILFNKGARTKWYQNFLFCNSVIL